MPAVTPVRIAPTLTIAGATARLARSEVFTTFAGHGFERTDDAAEAGDGGVGGVGDAADVGERFGNRRRERRNLAVDFIERSVEPAQEVGDARAKDEHPDPDQENAETRTDTEDQMRPIDL